MDTCKAICIILLCIYTVNCCTFKQHIYNCYGNSITQFPAVNETIKNSTSMIIIQCTKIYNITSLNILNWPQLRILAAYQNRYISCVDIHKLKTADITIYCYNTSTLCPLNKPPVYIPPPKKDSYSYLYSILFFLLLPSLIYICTCISVKTLSTINKENKKKKRKTKYTFLGHTPKKRDMTYVTSL